MCNAWSWNTSPEALLCTISMSDKYAGFRCYWCHWVSAWGLALFVIELWYSALLSSKSISKFLSHAGWSSVYLNDVELVFGYVVPLGLGLGYELLCWRHWGADLETCELYGVAYSEMRSNIYWPRDGYKSFKCLQSFLITQKYPPRVSYRFVLVAFMISL